MEWIEAQQTGVALDDDASVFDMERAGYNESSEGEQGALDVLDDVFALDALPSDGDTAAGMRAMGFTDEEINELANPRGTDGQGQVSAGQADARGTGQRAPDVRGSHEAPRQAQGESGEVDAEMLTSYTPAELARREMAEQQARKQKTQAIGPYTSKKDSGLLIRDEAPAGQRIRRGPYANEPGGRDDYTQDLFGTAVPAENRDD